jgi:peptidoglycan/xylan/chitin deacetylase (PgdA/CDA1 family)
MSKYAVANIFFFTTFICLLVLHGILSISVYWFIGLFAAYLFINLVASFYLSAGYFIAVESAGAAGSGAISITFDDGPILEKTEKILNLLNEHKVKAAFFCIGYRVRQNADLASRIHSEGHLLGNHSYWHKPTFDWQSSKKISQELMDTDAAIQEVTGRLPLFFRPPFGVTNPMVAKAIRQRNYTVTGWSVRSFDTVIRNEEKLFHRVTHKLKPGDVVVFHDYSDAMLSILPAFIAHVSTIGLKIVRLDELLNAKAYE